jgi:Transposase IS66 family
VVAGNQITRAGCWAHMKRKIIDAEKAAPEIAREAVERVRDLYAIERRAKDATAEQRFRCAKSNRHRYWQRCANGCLSGKNSHFPGIPWLRRSTMLWASGMN